DDDVVFAHRVEVDGDGLKVSKRARSPLQRALMKFPMPVLCVVAFLLMGFLGDLWHPGWLVFLLIPAYYAIVAAAFSRTKRALFCAAVPLVTVIAYVAIGLITQLWHPTWLIFLAIPAVYCIVLAMPKRTGEARWRRFPIWAFALAGFLFAGLQYGQWVWCWALLLAIPAYYTLISVIYGSRKGAVWNVLLGVALLGAYAYLGFALGLWHPGWLVFMAWPLLSHTVKTISNRYSFRRYVAKFPFFMTCLGVYLLLGCVYGLWHPWWALLPGSMVLSSFANLLAGNAKWSSVSFGGAIIVLYLALGIFFGLWHPWWVLILTIPLFEYVVSLVRKRGGHDYEDGEVDAE
ncbi:MAG: hypothetical protein Q4B99_05615, partial [Clostridia bacterium]|nr:hypothetical protein [Clostridia bacterium]